MRYGFGVKCILGLLLVALGASSSAHAYSVFCVGNAPQLNFALQHALFASDTTVIELVQGTYNLNGTLLTTASASDAGVQLNAVKLLGGYDSTCANRTLNPENTVFDGGGLFGNLDMQGSLTIEGIRFQNFNASTEFYVRMAHIDNTSTTVRNNHFAGTGLRVLYLCSDDGSVDVTNNLISRSPVNGLWLTSACHSLLTGTLHTTNGLRIVFVTSNTVVDSAGRGVIMQFGEPVPPGVTPPVGEGGLTNNIVWGSAGQDVYLQTGDLDHNNDPSSDIFIDNIYGSLFGSEISNSSGSMNIDPQFVNPGAMPDGDFRLQSSSPAINSAFAFDGLTSTDLDGNPRVIGSAPDRGAYESNVNDIASTTLIVTNAHDSGEGSLRQAIIDANASGGTHYIEFNIDSSGCPFVINLASDLPNITVPTLSINGFTQPGSKRNTVSNGDSAIRCIVLNGQSRPNSTGLLFYGARSGFYQVQGLAFEGFTSAALNLSAGQNNLVWGNQFGGQLRGASNLHLSPNAIDIWLYGANTTSQIGGTDPGSRNIIAGASGSDLNYGGRGIALPNYGSASSTGNSIINNLIGLDYRESTSGGKAVGVQIETAGNSVLNNVIGNSNNGIQVRGASTSGNVIQNNRIGLTEPFCSPALPPLTGCIWFDGTSAPNQAGIYFWQGAHDNRVLGNTITNNTLFGIELTNDGTYRNQIASNSIYANPAVWAGFIGNHHTRHRAQINLDGFKYGYNNPDSTAPNRGLNYPVIQSANGGPLSGTITGYLSSSNDSYAIEVFSTPTCEAGGAVAHTPKGATTIANGLPTLGANGVGTFSFAFTSPPGLNLAGRYITATATDSHGNTSPFSHCVAYQCVNPIKGGGCQ
ncbi:choice-of-anchor Q domain-containing protein [Dokdonella soli]|uniref:Periplasmic copper-binding protein NosD beta helix domain-containing protein n=1 Tax=Dokdonella soli TaxID=529810 RepID=A0ABN1IRT0_9GAMM